MKNNTIIEFEGYNLISFLNFCSNNNVSINNLIKKSPILAYFEIDDTNLNKLKKLDLAPYNLKIKHYGGLKKIKSIFLNRIGLAVGLVLSIILMVFTNNRLLNIHIYGLTSISKDEFIAKLDEYGVSKFKLMNFNISNLELALSDDFDLSLVSIIKKGNSLIINIKEELTDITNLPQSIYAECDMVIKAIDVYAGEQRVTVGEIVKKGDILVDCNYTINGELKKIQPSAKIKGELYISSTYDFKNQEEIMIKTGKNKVVNLEYYLGKIKLFTHNSESQFGLYEYEEINNLISNYFIPISIKKKVCHELEKVVTNHVYNDEKEYIYSTLKNNCYSKLPDGVEVKNEMITETEMSYGKIINMHLICDVEYVYK